MALAAFVRGTQAQVWRLCRHLGDAASADDLTQDTYLRAIRALPAFRGDASAATWLLGIARRTCADAVRSSRRRRALPSPAPRVEADPAAASAVRHLVAGLAADRREALVLTQIVGLSYAEAAAVCAVPVGTIRSRVARARADLVAALDEAAAQ